MNEHACHGDSSRPEVTISNHFEVVAELTAERDRLRDLVSSIWLYIGRYEETQLTTEQKELLADTVEATTDEPFEYERWWRQ